MLLLTAEGRVEYIDVLTCLQAGYCCAGGPLLGAADVRPFTTDTDENGLRRICAVTGGGEQIDLWDLIDAGRHSMSESLYGACPDLRLRDRDAETSRRERVE